jgi:hypothetical protein
MALSYGESQHIWYALSYRHPIKAIHMVEPTSLVSLASTLPSVVVFFTPMKLENMWYKRGATRSSARKKWRSLPVLCGV